MFKIYSLEIESPKGVLAYSFPKWLYVIATSAAEACVMFGEGEGRIIKCSQVCEITEPAGSKYRITERPETVAAQPEAQP